MKSTEYFAGRILLIITIVVVPILFVSAQKTENHQEDPNAKIFITYLQNSWDDIHDVIMRFHYDDPTLKGIVFINMEWKNGTMYSAIVDSNNTGNKEFGIALVEAMKKWDIPGLSEKWVLTLPVRTEIVGSNQTEFVKCGIFTGKVLDTIGNPIKGANLKLTSLNNKNQKLTPVFTNREGIFIKTLIPAGDWILTCTKDGSSTVSIDMLSFVMGQHIKKSIIMNQ